MMRIRILIQPRQERCQPVGVDEDCDGLIDELDPDSAIAPWWPDLDGDGYGGSGPTVTGSARTIRLRRQ